MNQKFNAVVGILLFLAFIGSFLTGVFYEDDLHITLAVLTLILVVVHVISYWKILVAAFRSFKKR
jgi:small-conductance mechanosensitive channel